VKSLYGACHRLLGLPGVRGGFLLLARRLEVSSYWGRAGDTTAWASR